MRKIVRYKNRKMYCHQEHRYISLQDISHWVFNDVDFMIIDNVTKIDQTPYVVSLILTKHAERNLVTAKQVTALLKGALNATEY